MCVCVCVCVCGGLSRCGIFDCCMHNIQYLSFVVAAVVECHNFVIVVVDNVKRRQLLSLHSVYPI